MLRWQIASVNGTVVAIQRTLLFIKFPVFVCLATSTRCEEAISASSDHNWFTLILGSVSKNLSSKNRFENVIAFPNIGIFIIPKVMRCKILIETVTAWLNILNFLWIWFRLLGVVLLKITLVNKILSLSYHTYFFYIFYFKGWLP